MAVSRCISYQYVPHSGENDLKMALTLEISGSGKAHAYLTNVQCSKTQCKYHMEEMTGIVLYICRN